MKKSIRQKRIARECARELLNAGLLVVAMIPIVVAAWLYGQSLVTL